jgi:uncharacterized YigZ family protein
MQDDRYLTIPNSGEGIYREKGSKFIGFAFPVKSEAEIKTALESIRKMHPTARHHCYAYRINPLQERWRANDDGEPSSSAGKPILNQLKSMELQNALVVVVRYFGGTLLGVPGLIHAYREAAKLALEDAGRIEAQLMQPVKVACAYAESGELMKWLKGKGYLGKPEGHDLLFCINIEIPYSNAAQAIDELKKRNWIVESLE